MSEKFNNIKENHIINIPDIKQTFLKRKKKRSNKLEVNYSKKDIDINRIKNILSRVIDEENK